MLWERPDREMRGGRLLVRKHWGSARAGFPPSRKLRDDRCGILLLLAVGGGAGRGR